MHLPSLLVCLGRRQLNGVASCFKGKVHPVARTWGSSSEVKPSIEASFRLRQSRDTLTPDAGFPSDASRTVGSLSAEHLI